MFRLSESDVLSKKYYPKRLLMFIRMIEKRMGRAGGKAKLIALILCCLAVSACASPTGREPRFMESVVTAPLDLNICAFQLPAFNSPPLAADFVEGVKGEAIFQSVRNVSSLEDATGCDLMLKLSQDMSVTHMDVYSAWTKKHLISLQTRIFLRSSVGQKLGDELKRAFDRGTPLYDQLVAERPAKHRPETATGTAAPPVHVVLSDVDELPTVYTRANKNAYAIVIGIENYRQKLPKADYAVADAKTMTEYLTKVLGYPEENVVTLLNDHATNVDLVKYFEQWLSNNVEKNSTVFIYYSGHGAPNHKTGDAYLVPYDGDPSFIAQTGYSLKRMYDALNKLQAKEIIVALDSCFSGAGGRSVIAKGARPLVMNLQDNMLLSKNMTVLSASSGDQTSSTYDEKGHGLFTYFMLKGIKNEDVVKKDGSIAISDLFNYLKPQVERIARKQYNNEQTPQLMGVKKN
jgi:hypothetical protein